MATRPSPPSALPALARPPLERRLGDDGAPYSAVEFCAFHGKGWESRWHAAPTEFRICPSGRLCSRAELLHELGRPEGRRAWEQAAPANERRHFERDLPISLREFLGLVGPVSGPRRWARAERAEPGVSPSLWAELMQQTAVRAGRVALQRGGPEECARLHAVWAHAPGPEERVRLRAFAAQAHRERRLAALAIPDEGADDAAATAGWMETLVEPAEAAEASGPSQPRRIAGDGSPRTTAEFLEIHGADWLEAWGVAAREERVDARGRVGDFGDFVEWFGAEDAPAYWERGVGAHMLKYAHDGELYGFVEFIEEFGLELAQRHWRHARPAPPGAAAARGGQAQRRRPAPPGQGLDRGAPGGCPLPDALEPPAPEAGHRALSEAFDGSDGQEAPIDGGSSAGTECADGDASEEASIDGGSSAEEDWLEFGSDLEHILFLRKKLSRLKRQVKALRKR